ncbi:metallophosphoesterase family protein [Alicyclobacillus acidoterrestris]|uniref:Serine/threonine protein phosphatase n=1 Tax=Alicyclobacillus acidoterrestris (strain ATCC 49025 / DSM 3922 / CIP 106132 / NCIMB 13137 / GD3B) TaxID=1356854 RepID=T0DDG9_ALIAG|nr:metallophosphoesterase family protein [Alicyclobacillus acidoterrestris]EPZ47706.1 hypothetical protein N007_05480 [Alicyclobacillus acidoterrestris ATCC 49025]UNO47980.1 serine/threonine protein phosphatase [Alicyclobacillus acidoterrestris]
MGRLLALSDIHGCYDQFDAILLESNYNPDCDQLVLLGDYIDRGPRVRDVLQRVVQLKKDGAICLPGNHEDMCINALSPRNQLDGYLDMQLWVQNGGWSTLDAFEGYMYELDRYVAWFKTLPLYHETDHYIFTHAHMAPNTPVSEQTRDDLLWGRHELPVGVDKVNVHGHTPVDGVILVHDQLYVDTGCVFRGKLSMVELPKDGDIERMKVWDVY